MVLMRVREWEEAASEEKKHIQSGKLKQRLPEQAVEARGGGREGGGRREKITN